MSDKINNEHDLGYKSLLTHKKTFLEFLRDFVKKDWVNLIKEEDLVLIDKEFILEDFKEEEADIVYKVKIGDKDIIFYILLEMQSKVDFSMPIRLLMYMTELWRDELKNTEKNIKKRKDFKLPSIFPIVLYNGEYNWTAPRSFKEVLSGYELFEDNIVDFKYMLFDVNRMDDEELLDIATVISSVFSLDQSGIDDEEIIRRLKVIGRFIRMKATKDQSQIFRNWIVNILQNRMDGEMKNCIQDAFEKTGEMEVDDMVSNLGRNLEESINKKVSSAKKESVIEIAKNLLDILSDDIISEKTGLTIDTIKKLREEKENLIH
ncbi:Rpn family recombination-promoting nuclease/putative transposase [Clostridium tagluense]|uniref:Rpn family recombination-promoting nuclease/putative transposase n=1 Tax=Clostridium tagluense TaxID=360422 RepID=UPI000F6243F3|nr:Rpn family recombination-promoting nuclease/putative transposase [Clostridium tagluense]